MFVSAIFHTTDPKYLVHEAPYVSVAISQSLKLFVIN